MRTRWGSLDGALRVSEALALILIIQLTACGGGSSTPPPPSASLSYPSGTQTFVVGTAITSVTPTITGTLSNFTVSPALPSGLTLDTSKGVISGTPKAVAATATYTISAMVSGGASTSASLSISVHDIAPSQVSYGASAFTFTTTVASSTLTPKAAGGAVVSWSINPALPAGLNFSATDGSISGTPSAPSASAAYVVTAQNTGGQSTVTLTIEVDAPLIDLGHQTAITWLRATPTNVLSADQYGYWILWGYAGATVVASGNSSQGCVASGSCLTPAIGMAGSTAAMVTSTGFEIHSTSDGHMLGSITTSATWWKLATDGTYIAAGSTTGLSVWSPAGQLLFTRAGDYSKAVAFAAPNQVLVGAGPAGQSVVETIAVPSGIAATGPQFNGQFGSWFLDGAHFITMAGTTALVYSSAGVQQGSIASVTANASVVGQGNWVWTYPNSGAKLNVYPAAGTNPAPAAVYTLGSLATPYASGMTVGVTSTESTALSVIDLSGTAPVKTDYTAPVPMTTNSNISSPTDGPYAAVSPSQWVVGSGSGVLLDGGSLTGTARFFGFGEVSSVAGGTGHFAVATASGAILYFNSGTLALEGQIAFPADKVVLSSDGTVLAAESSNNTSNSSRPVEVYTLPAGSLQYTWPYTYAGGVIPQDIVLSGSGAVLGQVLFNLTPQNYTQEAGSPTGGSVIFSSTFNGNGIPVLVPAMRISPDGTLIAASQFGLPYAPNVSSSGPIPGANLLHNGTLVTAFSGLPAGWLDNGRLLVNNYVSTTSHTNPIQYSGCTLYGPAGSPTGGACAVPLETAEFQTVTADTIYVPRANQVLSVSTGTVGWMSGDPFTLIGDRSTSPLGALAGAHVIFVSGISLLAQSY